MDWYSEVFEIIFPDLDRAKANECKICEWQEQNKKKESKEKSEDSD